MRILYLTTGENKAMQQYKDFQPTAFDPKGLNLPDKQDWLVSPISITRDTPSHAYTLSNWHVILKELERIDPDQQDHEACSFNHWGPGWFEIVIVKPDTPSHAYLDSIVSQLDDYPILDEDDVSEREHESALESWKWLDMPDRLKAVENARSQGYVVSTFAIRSSDMPCGICWEAHSDGIYFF